MKAVTKRGRKVIILLAAAALSCAMAVLAQAAVPEAASLNAAKDAGLTGVVSIKGKKYVLDSKSELSTGSATHVIKVGDTCYLVKKSGRIAKKGWHTLGKRKYYVKNRNGVLTGRGVCKVGKKYYFFTARGKLARKKKDRIVSLNGKDYYVKSNGQMGKGWQTIGKNNYCCKKDGELYKNTTRNGIKINAKGIAKTRPAPPKSAMDLRAEAIVASITNSGMSMGQKLAACWRFVTSSANFRYSTAYYPAAYTKSEFQRLALIMLNGRAGNCYCFACAFAALAKAVGYPAYVVYGRCPGSRDGAADGYTRHCWGLYCGRIL